MKSLLYLSLLILFFSGTAEKNAVQKKDTFYLSYETPTGSVEITDTMIARKVYIDDYNNPVSSTPTSRRIQTSSACVDRLRVRKFSNNISTSGFKKLNAEYGIAPTERYYPYKIRVKLGCMVYEVIYRSNPSGPAAPKAFIRVEKLISELLKENNMSEL